MSKKKKETYNRSRMAIVDFVIQACSRMYSGNPLEPLPDVSEKRGFICNYSHNVKIEPGTLCRLDLAPHSKYYLSWYMGEENGEYYLQSIEDHSVVRASNVVLSPITLNLKDYYHFRYSDRQFAFQDRWDSIVKKHTYWIKAMYSIFQEDSSEVTLRFRRKFEDEVFERKLPSWEDATDEEMEDIIINFMKSNNEKK